MSARISAMKSEDEVAARLHKLRTQLKSLKDDRKAYAKQTGARRSTLGIKNLRLVEGEIVALAWVLGVPDAGPTPTVQ